ncbi:Uncharacterised protein [Salmonella enterica subsp. enterica serovar Sanjuan]|uniref:Uncharacterized protein n=1 Tax=Salmonella enterica subsp. enterica serovar Sanjuan TaxID=1160765 RepID=A0A447NXY4_SALET|nr:Uncharacterised protein [Salmonella enterica subsp. enterica serovar Sanjuan]
MHIVNLFQHQRRPATGGLALNPGWAGLLQTIQHLTADLKANMLSGMKTDALAQPHHPGAEDKDQYQQDKREQQRFPWNVLHDHMLQDTRHDPGLSDN